MVIKKENESPIPEIKASLPPLAPIFSNIVAVVPSRSIALVDFGFVAPNYSAPVGESSREHLEDNQVARICLSWDAAESLAESMKEAIKFHKNQTIRKAKGAPSKNLKD